MSLKFEALRAVDALTNGIEPPPEAVQRHTEYYAKFSECHGCMMIGVAYLVLGEDYALENFERGEDGIIRWNGRVEADFGRGIKDYLAQGAQHHLALPETHDAFDFVFKAAEMLTARKSGQTIQEQPPQVTQPSMSREQARKELEAWRRLIKSGVAQIRSSRSPNSETRMNSTNNGRKPFSAKEKLALKRQQRARGRFSRINPARGPGRYSNGK